MAESPKMEKKKNKSINKSLSSTSLISVHEVVFLDHFKSLLNPVSLGAIPYSFFPNDIVQSHDKSELNRPITGQEKKR